jgi:hypothetical protein
MTRRLTVLFAAAEALLVVAIGLALPLLLFTVLWAAQFGFGPEWSIFYRASVDVWLLGHGVDVTFTLDPLLSASLGMAGSEVPVTITIALLGFALVTALLGARAGRRIAESGHLVLGQLVAVLLVAALGLGLALSAWHPAAQPSRWQSAVLPAAVFGIGLLLGVRRARDEQGDRSGRVRELFQRIPEGARDALGSAVRVGFASAAGLLVLASLVTAGAIAVKYAPIITLYESLHTEALGGTAITLGQLALLPDLVVWTASWLVGPGFAIGAGSSVSPLGTDLGPIPAIPVLGALPNGDPAFGLGFAGLVAPVAAAFLIAVIFAPRMRTAGIRGGWLLVVGLGAGIVGGAALGILAWGASGSAGPGRLAEVGPNPWAVGAFAALEFALGACLGLAAASRKPRAARR